MTSRSPFTSQGIRICKIWTNFPKAAGNNDYIDYGVRMAKAFNNIFAGKVNFTHT
jgi:hypothetical protein